MATFGTLSEFNRLIKAAPARDSEAQRQNDAENAAALEMALESGSMLLDIFTTLPKALIASRRDEQARLDASGEDDRARAQDVAASVEALETIEAVAAQARLRVSRVLRAREMRGAVFHGFVRAVDGSRLEGLTVQVASDRLKRTFTGPVGADGYFLVALDDVTLEPPVGGQPRAAGDALLASIAITDRRGTALYEDPIPMELTGNTAYREYEIEPPESRPTPQRRRPR